MNPDDIRNKFIEAGYKTANGYDLGCGCCKIDFEVEIDGVWEIFEDGRLWVRGEPVELSEYI